MSKIKETLHYSDYEHRERRPSRIDPTKSVVYKTWFICPKCGKDHYGLIHGKGITCYCGLKMVLFGNALECEMDD